MSNALARSIQTVVMATVVFSGAFTSFAATVTVLRPDGRPAAGVAVMCRGHEKDPVLTDDDGLARIPADCPVVNCMTGGYLPGKANVISSAAVCRLIEGVRVTVRLEGPGGGERCFVALVPVALDGDRSSREFGRDPGTTQPEARLDVVRPGAYTVEVSCGLDWWRCARLIELRRTGAETIPATWRPPIELRGIAIGENGAPVADIPIRVRAGGATSDRRPAAWQCSRDDASPDLFSAEDGAFVVPIDPATGGVIEAGSSWDPDGSGSVEVAPPLPLSVTLRLKRSH